ncbi:MULTISPECIES: ferredoxin [Actinosynnema]|uniref:ferredoxin n=1 Tax=Actinosynnema TaxID=40566 RepID=UPI0020A42CAE|nr:ferredoxin [Actinosynnema pretiosum]MCP2092973.1 ferredoxin [Actinosynnema pretiosum]
MPEWSVEVDRDTCIGSGMCAAIAAGHFRLDDGRAAPLASPVEPADDVVDAAESCPVEAILVRDQGGEVVAPQD